LLADDVESISELTSPVLAQVHALNATDLESSSETASPSLAQVHALLADDVESASEVSSPVLTEGTNILLADDIESSSEVSTPSLTQVHALLAGNIESGSNVSVPALDGTVPLTAVVGGHFGQDGRRKRIKEDRKELRHLIEQAAGLLDEAEEIAGTIPEQKTDSVASIKRPVFKSQVVGLRSELNAIRSEIDRLPRKKATQKLDKSREVLRGIVARSVNDIIEQIAHVLTDLIQEVIEDGR